MQTSDKISECHLRKHQVSQLAAVIWQSDNSTIFTDCFSTVAADMQNQQCSAARDSSDHR